VTSQLARGHQSAAVAQVAMQALHSRKPAAISLLGKRRKQLRITMSGRS